MIMNLTGGSNITNKDPFRTLNFIISFLLFHTHNTYNFAAVQSIKLIKIKEWQEWHQAEREISVDFRVLSLVPERCKKSQPPTWQKGPVSIWKTEKNICPFEIYILLLLRWELKGHKKCRNIFLWMQSSDVCFILLYTHDRNMQNVIWKEQNIYK